jgi:hypothetical protein
MPLFNGLVAFLPAPSQGARRDGSSAAAGCRSPIGRRAGRRPVSAAVAREGSRGSPSIRRPVRSLKPVLAAATRWVGMMTTEFHVHSHLLVGGGADKSDLFLQVEVPILPSRTPQPEGRGKTRAAGLVAPRLGAATPAPSGRPNRPTNAGADACPLTRNRPTVRCSSCIGFKLQAAHQPGRLFLWCR